MGPIEDGFQISSHDFVAVFFGISCLFFADSECIVAIKKLRNTRLRGPSLFLAATDRYTVVKSGKGLIVFCGSMRAARIHPLMLGSHLSLFKGAQCFKWWSRARDLSVLAAGGGYITFTTGDSFLFRYDHPLGHYAASQIPDSCSSRPIENFSASPFTNRMILIRRPSLFSNIGPSHHAR